MVGGSFLKKVFPYGDHKSFLSFVGLPLVLLLLGKVKLERMSIKVYLVKDRLLVPLGIKRLASY